MPPLLIDEQHNYILYFLHTFPFHYSHTHTHTDIIHSYTFSLSLAFALFFHFRVDVMFFFIVISCCCCLCIATVASFSYLFFPFFRFCMTSIRFSGMLSGLSISISILLHFLLTLSKITAVTQRDSERQTGQRERIFFVHMHNCLLFLNFNFEFNVIYLIFGDVSCLWLHFVQNALLIWQFSFSPFFAFYRSLNPQPKGSFFLFIMILFVFKSFVWC